MRRITNTNNNITSEDKALFRSLCETYDYSEIDRYFKELQMNEGHFTSVANPEFYAGTTPGTTERGIKGAVKALPSLVISTLLCPAGTLIALIGAVRIRFEKQFTKSLFNLDRWADFVGTSKEKQKSVVDKVKREVAEKTRYFMAKLANGEVIRVVASHAYEAKQMALAIENELVIPQEKEFSLMVDPNPGESKPIVSERDSSNDTMWILTFDDGEVLYWQADKNADKKEIVKEANKQRQFIAAGFAKKFKKITGKRLQGVGNSYDKEYEPIKVAVVESIEPVTTNQKLKRITDYNKEDIQIYDSDRLSSHEKQDDNLIWYTLKSKRVSLGSNSYPIIQVSLPTLNEEELTEFGKRVFNSEKYNNWVNNVTAYINTLVTNEQKTAIQVNAVRYQFANKRWFSVVLPLQKLEEMKKECGKLASSLYLILVDAIKHDKDLDPTTRERAEKYVFSNGINYKPENLGNLLLDIPAEYYKTAFTENTTLTKKDTDGKEEETNVDLTNIAA